MNIKKSKGFTIIELLVVIAIIAVLAAIVLVNVTQYISKGKRAAIQGNMATISTNAAVWYDGNSNTYVGFPASSGYTNPAAAIATAGGTVSTPTATSTAFCACTTLPDVSGSTGQTYCVDSTGNKKQTATACATECPAAGACI